MAKCAACGLAIRNREQLATSGYFVVHRVCVAIPREAWTITRLVRDRSEDLERRVRKLEREATLFDGRVADAERRTASAEALIDEYREQAKRARENIHEFMDLCEGQREQINALRRAASSVDARRGVTDLEKQAYGLAVGRGVWGFAALSARLAVDGKDDSEARYALLELH